MASADWASVWGTATPSETEAKTLAFFASDAFANQVHAVPEAAEALKPLRKLFSFVAVTDRPRAAEKATRDWLDTHFGGVFDKLVFVDGERKARLGELKAKLAIGADQSKLVPFADKLKRVLVVGSVPWADKTATPETPANVVALDGWAAVKDALTAAAKELELKPVDKVHPGPKLARYTDDLVTVSTRKPAVFYANIVTFKFTTQKQAVVRLQAAEGAITTAVQTAELLRLQGAATTAKISTRYVLNRPKERGGFRVPKIEIVLHHIEHADG